MYRRDDPRLRRTLNQFTSGIETANEQAQVGLYEFGQRYINPCLGSIGACFQSCVEPCFPGQDEQRRRRQRGRSRGRVELNFDFYDDWDDDQDDLVGWGNDELEQLLGNPDNVPPGRERAMSYGTRNDRSRGRKSISIPHEGTQDPTVIPKSNILGFLDRFSWMSHKGLKYKPSAADLQEHPGRRKRHAGQDEPLLEEEEDVGYQSRRHHGRNRRGTGNSGHTTDSMSSRGDIFPSEDELEDAQPLDDDEFAFVLERRGTGISDEASGARSKSRSKRSSRSKASLRTVSSKSVRSSVQSLPTPEETEPIEPPTISELKAEEEAVRREEEGIVEKKREAAQQLALQKGFKSAESSEMVESTPQSPASPQAVPLRPMSPPIPFPAFDVDKRASSIYSRAQSEERLNSRPSSRPSLSAQTSSREEQKTQPEFVPAALPRFRPAPD